MCQKLKICIFLLFKSSGGAINAFGKVRSCIFLCLANTSEIKAEFFDTSSEKSTHVFSEKTKTLISLDLDLIHD